MSLALLVTSFNSTHHLDRFFSWMSLVNHLFTQVIIIDDCSTDNSFSRILEEGNRYSNFLIKRRLNNSGRPSLPRNEGMQLVSADRLVFLDIDDLLPVKYVEYLSRCNTEHCYSGMKFATPEQNYNCNYDCDFSKVIKIKNTTLKYKNLVTLSGASLPSKIAKKYYFANEPLEDWDYWVKVSNAEPQLDFVKFSDVPIYYDEGQSLSPIKNKQIMRVLRKIGYLKVVVYFFQTFRLRYIENVCKRRFLSANN
jgi:glycosyltransferase involved in cell wall biosynthesis